MSEKGGVSGRVECSQHWIKRPRRCHPSACGLCFTAWERSWEQYAFPAALSPYFNVPSASL